MSEQSKYMLFQQVIEKTVTKGGFVSFDDRTLENYDEVVGYCFMVDDLLSIKGSKFVTTFSIGKEDLICQNFPIAQAISSAETPVTKRYLPVPEGLKAAGNLVEGIYQDGNQGIVASYTLILILLLKKYL